MKYQYKDAGNTRIKRKFLLLPRTFNNERKWLCYSDIVERLEPEWAYNRLPPPPLNHNGMIDPYWLSGYYLKWNEIAFADTEALINGTLNKVQYFSDESRSVSTSGSPI